VRNTFQRLWMRANILDRGRTHDERWELLNNLTEDAMVQLIERPSISADIRVAKFIAEAWLKKSKIVGTSAMERIMRKAIIDFRIRSQIQHMSFLSDEDLVYEIEKVFEID